jgi:predicted nucleic acid-binding protein
MSLLAEPPHHPGQRRLLALLKAYEQAGYVAGISMLTIAEERRTGDAANRLAWWRSQLVRVPVSEQIAAEADTLLDRTGLSGHRSVVDAVVVATAASSPEQARVLSSDESNILALAKAATERRRGVPVAFKKI